MQKPHRNDTLSSWCDMAKQLRINPAAVARQLLTRLDDYKALTASEESRVIYAIESTGVPVERVLADLSKKSIRELLNEIQH